MLENFNGKENNSYFLIVYNNFIITLILYKIFIYIFILRWLYDNFNFI
jgi:hypothetical protein